jgi:hypothetical protein
VEYQLSDDEFEVFWEWPENAPFVNEAMIRLMHHNAVDAIIHRDSIDGVAYKKDADSYLVHMVLMYCMLKFGPSQEENHVAFRLAFTAECYHRLVEILDILSPCDCLSTELERAREEAEQEDGGRLLLLECERCGEKEESTSEEDKFHCCAGCKLVRYCCWSCHRDDWREPDPAFSHKIACQAIRDLQSLIRGGGGDSNGAAPLVDNDNDHDDGGTHQHIPRAADSSASLS